MDEQVWHVFKKGLNGVPGGVPFWLGSVEAQDAASACAIVAHNLRRAGDKTVPSNDVAVLHAVPDEAFVKCEAGFFADELLVDEVG